METRHTKIMTALYNQILNYTDLSYAKGHQAENIWDIVGLGVTNFWNIIPSDPSKRIERVDEISKMQMKRHVYRITLQYGVRSATFMKAILGDDSNEPDFVGILDFQDDLWAAIEADHTLGGAVRGLIPDFEPIPFDMVKDTEEDGFVAGGAMELEYFNDIPIPSGS